MHFSNFSSYRYPRLSKKVRKICHLWKYTRNKQKLVETVGAGRTLSLQIPNRRYGISNFPGIGMYIEIGQIFFPLISIFFFLSLTSEILTQKKQDSDFFLKSDSLLARFNCIQITDPPSSYLSVCLLRCNVIRLWSCGV